MQQPDREQATGRPRIRQNGPMRLQQALQIVEHVVANAPGPVSVFVADGHGEIVAAATMDSAAPDTRLNAQRKAYTAARSDASSTAQAGGEGARQPGRAGEFRSVLHLLPRRPRGLRRRAQGSGQSASAACREPTTLRSRPPRSSPPGSRRDRRADHRDPGRRARGAARAAARARPRRGPVRLRALRRRLHPVLHRLLVPLERAAGGLRRERRRRVGGLRARVRGRAHTRRGRRSSGSSRTPSTRGSSTRC